MERVAIYLAGNIKKGHEKLNEDYWSDTELSIISNILKPIQIDFLHPAIRTDDLSDQKSVFGRDLSQVYCSNVVFVDVRQRRGLGVGAEMMWAKMNAIPVVTLCPPESHYKKREVNILNVPVDNWTHPFVENLSDQIVATIEEGAHWIHSFVIKNESKVEIKTPAYIKEAMDYYRETQYTNDEPMKELTSKNKKIHEYIHG
jgi:hypothetical protein